MAAVRFITKKNLEYFALNRQINLVAEELRNMNVDVEETVRDLEMKQMGEMLEFLKQVRDKAKEVS